MPSARSEKTVKESYTADPSEGVALLAYADENRTPNAPLTMIRPRAKVGCVSHWGQKRGRQSASEAPSSAMAWRMRLQTFCSTFAGAAGGEEALRRFRASSSGFSSLLILLITENKTLPEGASPRNDCLGVYAGNGPWQCGRWAESGILSELRRR